MIKEAREKEPFIHFGFNKQTITAHLNDEIVIWQENIFKENQNFTVFTVGHTIIENSNNKIILSFNTLGSKLLLIENLNGVKSNVITAIIEPITWDSKDIFFNNTDITFNSI